MNILQAITDNVPLENFFSTLFVVSNRKDDDFKQTLPKKKHKKLVDDASKYLKSLSSSALNDVFLSMLDSSLEVLDNPDEEDANFKDVPEKKKILVLRGSVLFLQAALQVESLKFSPDMLKLVIVLHNILPNMETLYPIIANDIHVFCVEVWQRNKSFKQEIWMNSFIYLLKDILHSKEDSVATKIALLYQMQPGLKTVDFEVLPTVNLNEDEAEITASQQDKHQDIAELLNLLLMTFTCSDFYSDRTGNKFLANTMASGKTIIKEAHKTLLQILQPSCPIDQAKTLGEIVYHAWKQVDDEMKEYLEENCLQDLMFRAIHAPRTRHTNLFKPYHAMLHSITSYKSSKKIRHALSRLYGPIIWRALKANNGMVRANASRLFFDAFPMELMATSNTESESYYEKQLTAMKDILLDDCSNVRTIGVRGVCEIMAEYWDNLPAHVIAIFAQTIFTKLAFDASCSDVRLAVYIGAKELMKHSVSHALLGKILPGAVKHGIHDPADKVRLAVLNVLDAVRFTTIKFWDICPVKNILQQLEIEKNKVVCRSIAELLKGSFLPSDNSYEEWVKRCVNFYKRNLVAAEKFYKNVAKNLTVEEIGIFLEKIGYCIVKYVKWSVNETDNNESQTDTNETQSEKPRGDSDSLCALLETACILWQEYQKNFGKKVDLSDEVKTKVKQVLAVYSNAIHVCLRHIGEERGINTVIILASFMEPEFLPLFSKSLISKLRSLPDNVPSTLYEALINCVSKWNYTYQLLQLVDEWIAIEDEEEVNNKRGKKTKRKKSRTVRFTVEEAKRRPQQASKYLKCLFNQARPDGNLVKNPQSIQMLKSISKSLAKYKNKIYEDVKKDDISISQALDLWFTIQLILHHQSGFEDASEVSEMIKWFKDDIFDKSEKLSEQATVSNNSVLSNDRTLPTTSLSDIVKLKSIMRDVLDVTLKNCIYLLTADESMKQDVESLLLKLVSSGNNNVIYDHCHSVITLINLLNQKEMLKQSFANATTNGSSADKSVQDEKPVCLILFNDFLCCLATFAAKEPDGYVQALRCGLRNRLKTFIEDNYLASLSIDPSTTFDDIITNSLVSCIVCMKYSVRSSEFVPKETIADLPLIVSTVLPILCQTNAMSELVYAKLAALDQFSTEDKDVHLLALANIFYTLLADGKHRRYIERSKDDLCQKNDEFKKIFEELSSTQDVPLEENEEVEEDQSQIKRKKVALAPVEKEEEGSDEENIIVFSTPGVPVAEELYEYT